MKKVLTIIFIVIFLNSFKVTTSDNLIDFSMQFENYVLSIKEELNIELENRQAKLEEELNIELENRQAKLEEELNIELENRLAKLNEELEEIIKDEVSTKVEEESATITNQLNTSSNDLQNIENMIVDVVDSKKQAVLGVSNYQYVNSNLVLSSTGSGVIYKNEDNNYYLVTNEHVINGADEIKVVLENNVIINANLVGSDIKTDIAVLKFQSSDLLSVVNFADIESVKLGQICIALGNPLGYDFYGSVTMGIVSGLTRQLFVDTNDDGYNDTIMTLMQHDASISPGNSGGPLLDINGDILGINNMKVIEEDVSNIGFAIPSDVVQLSIDKIENGTVN